MTASRHGPRVLKLLSQVEQQMNKVKKGNGVLKITQIKSAIGRKPGQKQTLVGLGLNKLHKTSTLEDTPAIRGMIDKVSHLLKIEDIK